MNKTSRWAIGTAGAAVAGAIVLAACGGSGTKHAAAPAAAVSATTAPAAPPTSAASASPAVTTKHDAKLGTILADAQGLTLYTLTNNGKPVDCTGTCATVWPPLTAPSAAAPPAAPGVPMLGTASLSDGTRVVTAGGLPVYRFAQDGDSGDAYGEGMSTFGGVWHVVHAGQSTASAAPTAGGRTFGGY